MYNPIAITKSFPALLVAIQCNQAPVRELVFPANVSSESRTATNATSLPKRPPIFTHKDMQGIISSKRQKATLNQNFK
jgi:hypothetical protein